MKKIVCFGELMLRLNPARSLRFIQADTFEMNIAGSEANVAVSLTTLGLETCFITKLPNHEIGQAEINSLRKYGVATDWIIQDENRIGIYYVEKGASQRSSKVIYDRSYSSFSLTKKTDFKWEEIFNDAEWFHFSGITPALGGELPEICLEACQIAKERGIPISCDWNYRKQLWSSKQAKEVMETLMGYVDICIAIDFDIAIAASYLKHTIEQDFNLSSLSEINSLIEEGGLGRVRR